MRKKVLKVLIGLLAVLLVALPVYAASLATITVVESSGNSYTMIGVEAPMDNTYLASHGFISNTGLDTDLNSLPFMLASDRTIVATSLTANGTVLLPYTTGNTPASAFQILTGYDGYITVLDVAALEPTNDFIFEIDAYVDIAQIDNPALMGKVGAFGTAISQTNTIFSWIWAANAIATQGGWAGQQPVWGTTWRGQTFTPATDAAITQVSLRMVIGAGAPTGDFIVSIQNTTAGLPTETDLTSITVDASTLTSSSNVLDLVIAYPVSSSTMYAIIVRHPTGDAGNRMDWQYSNANPYAGGTDLLSNNSGASWVTVPANDRTFIAIGTSWIVESAAVTVGEHNIVVEANPGANTFGITVDTVPVTITLGAATVPNNVNDWIINQSNVMPYISYYKHTIASTLIASYQPAAIIGGQTYSTGTVTGTTGTATITGTTTTWVNNMVGGLMLISGDSTYYTISSVTDNTHLVLTTDLGTSPAGATYDMYPKLIDQTGGDQPGLITWGTNPAGVAIDVGALLPSVAVTPATGIPDVSDLVPEYNPTISSGVEGANFPLYDLFKGLMADFQANGGPEITMPYFWKIVATIIALILGTAVLVATKNIVIGVGAYAGLIAIPTAMGILDWYYIIWYVIGAIAVSLLVTKWTSSSI